MKFWIKPMLALALAVTPWAALQAKSDQVKVTAESDGRYGVDAFIVDARMLVGVLGDMKETDGAVSAVLRIKGRASDAQRHEFAAAVRQAELIPFLDDDDGLRELTEE